MPSWEIFIDKNLENKIDCDAPILSKSICEKWVLSYPGSPVSYKKNPETLFLDEVKNTLPENRKSLFYFYAIPPEKIEKYKGEAIKACANLSK